MTSTCRWLVALEGDRMDLEEFPYWFPDGTFYAVVEDPSVLLTGEGFNACMEPDQAKAVAAQVLDEYGATISLLWPSYRAPTLGTVYEQLPDGSRKGTQIGMVGAATSRTKVRGTLSLPPGAKAGPTQAQALWAAAKAAPHLDVTIMLWADPVRTWPRLYRMLEEIEAHLEKPANAAGFCSANERERFMRSANSAEVAGKDSRHAGGKFETPSKPMSIRDATVFLRSVLTKVLQSAGVAKSGSNAA